MQTKSLIKNFIYKIILNIFNIILPLLIIPYVYRLFSPEIMGKIEFTQSIVGYFLIFAGLGVYTFGLREISKLRNDKLRRDKSFTELFCISTISTLLVFLIYLTYVLLKFNSDIVLKNLLLINSIGILSGIFYIEWMNEAFENYSFITKKTVTIKMISVVFIFLFLKKEMDFYKYLLITNSVIFFNNIISFIYIKNKIRLKTKEMELKKYILPLMTIVLINNINVLYITLDKLTLGFYTSSLEVAYYGIGQKIMTIVLVMIITITTVSTPRLSYYLDNEKEKYEILLNKLLKYVAILVFPISIGIFTLREEITLFFGGIDYLSASTLVGIFGVRMGILVYESILSNQILFLHKKEKVMFVIFSCFGLINVILKFLLIKNYFGENYNSISATISTMSMEMCIILTEVYYTKNYLNLKIQFFSKNIKYYLGTSLLFIPISNLIKQNKLDRIFFSIVTVGVCTAFYLIVLFTIKDDCLLEVINNLKKIKNFSVKTRNFLKKLF